MIAALQGTGARFLVVGAHALAVHGVPRATGDLDILVSPEPENASRVWRALLEFGAPVEALGFEPGDLESPGMVLQIGVPPRRIDLLTEISGVTFLEAWESKVEVEQSGLTLPFLGRTALVTNKRASGRPKDVSDLLALGEPESP